MLYSMGSKFLVNYFALVIRRTVRRIILDFAIRRMTLACTYYLSVHAPAQSLTAIKYSMCSVLTPPKPLFCSRVPLRSFGT